MYLTPYVQNLIGHEDIAESLKFEFDRRIYHYGNQFLNSTESNSAQSRNKKIALAIRDLIILSRIITKNASNKIPANSIVSNSYVSIKNTMNSKQHNFIKPPWDLSLKQASYIDVNAFFRFRSMKNFLEHSHFNELLAEKALTKIGSIQNDLTEFYSSSNVIAGLFPNDVTFFEVQSIQILKKLKKKSFVLLHGVPGIYNNALHSKSDYLFVWGMALKNIFIQQGFSPDKIKVVGHPLSAKLSSPPKIRSSLDSVLVLGSSMPGGQFDKNEALLWDRGNIILYCYMIQRTLQRLGVKKAKIRPHPSESKSWYSKFIDLNFFEFDNSSNIHSAVQASSLVIGPTSSSFIETIAEGVNYITFEPFYENSKSQYKLVPPFDGSDPRLLVTKSENELYETLKNNRLCDSSLLEDYLGAEYRLDEVLSELL